MGYVGSTSCLEMLDHAVNGRLRDSSEVGNLAKAEPSPVHLDDDGSQITRVLFVFSSHLKDKELNK